jgi:hypothetical protein
MRIRRVSKASNIYTCPGRHRHALTPEFDLAPIGSTKFEMATTEVSYRNNKTEPVRQVCSGLVQFKSVQAEYPRGNEHR